MCNFSIQPQLCRTVYPETARTYYNVIMMWKLVGMTAIIDVCQREVDNATFYIVIENL